MFLDNFSIFYYNIIQRPIYFQGMEHSISKKIMIENIERVEKWTKVLTIFLYVMPLLGVLSRAIPSFFFFLVTDLGNEAFQLPVPLW